MYFNLLQFSSSATENRLIFYSTFYLAIVTCRSYHTSFAWRTFFSCTQVHTPRVFLTHSGFVVFFFFFNLPLTFYQWLNSFRRLILNGLPTFFLFLAFLSFSSSCLFVFPFSVSPFSVRSLCRFYLSLRMNFISRSLISIVHSYMYISEK